MQRKAESPISETSFVESSEKKKKKKKKSASTAETEDGQVEVKEEPEENGEEEVSTEYGKNYFDSMYVEY